MKLTISCAMAMLLPIVMVAAQPEPVTIGDKMPDITIQKITGDKTVLIKLSSLNKPIILSFFASFCGICIGSLPKIDSLQKAFGDSVQIIIVSHDKSAKYVNDFLSRRYKNKKFAVQFAMDDSTINALFPHKSIPLEVWINKAKNVVAITGNEYITSINIRKFISNQELDLPVNSERMDFDKNLPLMAAINGVSENDIIYQSTFTKRQNGISSTAGQSVNADSTQLRSYFHNKSIINLYLQIFGHQYSNRILLEAKDSSSFIQNKNDLLNWLDKNTYCYELNTPIYLSREQIKTMQLEDINRFLQLNSRIEKRKIDCWALVITDSSKVPVTKGGKSISTLHERNATLKTFRNKPLSAFTSGLEYYNTEWVLNPRVLDETNFTPNVDMDISLQDLHDMQALRNTLAGYGLDLLAVKRELEMLVISDK